MTDIPTAPTKAYARCMGPWPACRHQDGECSSSPSIQRWIVANNASRTPEPTTNPILEKMARAMCEADGFDWEAQTSFATSANGDEDGQAYYLDHASAALRSLLPLDEEGVDAAFLVYRKASGKRIEAVITAFINHAIGGK